MADASYDVVVIGGGNKSIVTAMYLAKYGGMDVAVFEARHEIGGGISSEEGPAPGFIANTHSSVHLDSYYPTVCEDFPQFEDRGAKYVHPLCSIGGIFKEDQSSLLIYHEEFDPDQERTAKQIAKFSEKDAEAWLYWWDKWKKIFEPAFCEWVHTPAQPPNVLDVLDKAVMRPDSGIEPQWLVMSPLQVMKDIFESSGMITMLLRAMHSFYVKSPATYGLGVYQLLGSLFFSQACLYVGGTHSIAHALFKCFVEHGGKVFTKCEVDEILTENGRAKGIRLSDGKEIEAKKLVLSGVNPQQLCLRMLDRKLVDPKIIRRIENLETDDCCITWYDWALHELPDYKAAADNPDVSQTAWLIMADWDEKRIVKNHGWLSIGKNPPGGGNLGVCPHSIFDPTRAPEGKHLIKTESECLSAIALTEREWLEFKKTHAEDELRELQKYAPNMTWDNVIGYYPLTSYDAANLLNMQPDGNMGSQVDTCPGQMGKFRPIPDLARHKVPGISNLYATSAAWHPGVVGSSWQGYNCYKIIADDLDLPKPWEKDGRPY